MVFTLSRLPTSRLTADSYINGRFNNHFVWPPPPYSMDQFYLEDPAIGPVLIESDIELRIFVGGELIGTIGTSTDAIPGN